METQAAVLTLLNGLRPGAFKDSLSKRPVKAMDEIQVRVERYIYLEETQRVTISLAKNQAEKKPGPQYEECQKKEPKAPRVRRFHDYTPLSVSIADLYIGRLDRLKNSQSQKLFGYGPTLIGPYSVNTTMTLGTRQRIAMMIFGCS